MGLDKYCSPKRCATEFRGPPRTLEVQLNEERDDQKKKKESDLKKVHKKARLAAENEAGTCGDGDGAPDPKKQTSIKDWQGRRVNSVATQFGKFMYHARVSL